MSSKLSEYEIQKSNMITRLNKLKNSIYNRNNCYFFFRNINHLIIIAVIASAIQILLFKNYYPFASFIFGDSFAYIQNAKSNSPIAIYPIGYSVFLHLIHTITYSDYFLVIIQYLLLQASTLFLIFSMFQLYNPPWIIRIFLFAFMVFNPLHLYLSNTISSDILFITLSITWFSLVMWIIHKPSITIHFFHAIILFLAFTVRYFALYYPLISIFAILITKDSLTIKISSLLWCIALIGSFIYYTQNLYYKICQKHIFNPFSGWLLANNALYAYRYVSNEQHKTPPRELERLDLLVRDYFDSTQNNPGHLMEQGETYFHYMWIPTSPLWDYTQRSMQPESKLKRMAKWASFAPIFKDYGWWIIKNYPIHFSRYYLWVNVKRYSIPPVEFLDSYNTGINDVPGYVQHWFHYKSNILSSKVKNPVYKILPIYPIWSAIINIQILLFIIIYVWLKCYRYYPVKINAILYLSFFWLINFGFEVFSTLISLRFQIFSIWIFTCYACILLGYIIIELKKTDG